MNRHRFLIGLLLTLPLMIGMAAHAQETTSGACPALVEQALAQMGQNCSDLSRNSACYGYNLVEGEFVEEIDEDTFTEPADTADLIELAALRTAPLDLDAEQWGIAVMNAQANVPDTLPGQAVTFILLGDSAVENRVPPEDVTPEVEPVEVVAAVRSNVRSGPGRTNNVIGVVDPGAALLADALSEDGAWLRVILGGRPGWIFSDVIEENPAIADLPSVVEPVISPMQAFYFSTGLAEPECADAPDVIGIRAPQNVVVDLSVNGADIRVGSVITLYNISQSQIALTVHQGNVETLDDNDDTDAAPDQTIIGDLSEDSTIIEWNSARPATPQEQALGDVIENALSQLGIAAEEDSAPLPPGPGGSCGGFRATSPTLGFGYGFNQFFWDAAPGADNYRVTVYNLSTGQSFGGETGGPATTLALELNDATVGGGFEFAWDVAALRGGRVICTSERIRLQRSAQPAPAAPTFSPTASTSCDPPTSFSTTISWGGFPPGDTVTVTYSGSIYSGTVSGQPPSGSTVIFSPDITSGSVTGSPSGLSAAIPPISGC
jgi:hypothetical protein